MPGIRTRVEPESAFDLSAADEAYQLELDLQRKFEEDVARIFDESIYSDFELVCGRSKILTHTCILKARTKRFYQKLETLQNFNINRNNYDEIYSFISDAYTECNINNQEKEILAYLDNNRNSIPEEYAAQTQSLPPFVTQKDIDESEDFLTPKCTSPYTEKRQVRSLSSSPSIELTKEYYALVPIDSSLLDTELKEQDVLSIAFRSIIKSQVEDEKKKKSLGNKPTSLSLRSSHAVKTSTHSNNCDNQTKFNAKQHCNDKVIRILEKKIDIPGETKRNTRTFGLHNSIEENFNKTYDLASENATESVYSPDSLIADDPSSSSDYLSTAYNYSPGVSSSGGISQLNVAKHINKMDNVFTSSDSGLENTGLLESLNCQNDVTLTDTSLTESTLHYLIADDTSYLSSSLPESNNVQIFKDESLDQIASPSVTSADKKVSHRKKKSLRDGSGCKSSKAEKQRQNEKIVVLESSSLSSETGSWESVFPPKQEEKEACSASNGNSNVSKLETKAVTSYEDDKCPSLVQRSPFKSTSCFIDAASLVDDDETIKIQSDAIEFTQQAPVRRNIFPAPSQPVRCSTAKSDISPNDWSESHDNDDSLEQLDAKDLDSLQEDSSLFEMTLAAEDSHGTNIFENVTNSEQQTIKSNESLHEEYEREDNYVSRSRILSSTPHNSIMSLRASKLKHNDSEDGDSDTTLVSQEGPSSLRKFTEYIDYSPIVSVGASIDDHFPRLSSHVGSPMARQKIEIIPVVSGLGILAEETKNKIQNSPKPTNGAAWVVDMSKNLDEDKNVPTECKKPGERTCGMLKNEAKNDNVQDTNNKSRSSVDSDSSEKSSRQFYIDLNSLPDPLPPKNENNSNSVNEKKNIFSMYIDIGEKSTLKEMPVRLSSSLNTKKNTESSKVLQASVSKTINNTQSAKRATSDSNEKTVALECTSITSNKNVSSKLFDTPPKNSTLKNDFTCKSSSSTFNNSLFFFEEFEDLCANSELTVNEIINLHEEKQLKTKPTDAKDGPGLEVVKEEKGEHHILETAKETKNCNKVVEAVSDVFVRLSDLDKPKLQLQSTDILYKHAVTDIRMTRSIPDSNNWGDASNTCTSRSIEVISSFHSENALSLNRLFPHLKTEFSRSMPGSLTSTTRSSLRGVSSNGEIEEQICDISEVSSMQSSFCPSVVENSTTEESQTSSLIANCQSSLGQDLLRMFKDEIAPDVIVEVSGRKFKAHKCILSSRCQYFAGILSGGWVESAGNVILLPPFAHSVVHFALCHIYSGVSTIPDYMNLVQLATLTDMLGLDGLKDAIMFTLKVKYCHNFHKPCKICIAGVVDCLPLCSVYGLDALYHKCLRWITKYFHKVWPTEDFAKLPKDLLDRCYQQHIVNMTTDNVVNIICGCGMTGNFAKLPKGLLDRCYQQHIVNTTPDNVVDIIYACGMTGNFAKLPKVFGRCYQQHIVNMTTDNVVNIICGCGMTGNFAKLPKVLLDICYQQHIVNMTPDNVVDTICGCGMTGNFAELPKGLLDRCYQQHIVNTTPDNVVDIIYACGMTGNFAKLPKVFGRCYQQHIVNMTTDNVVNIICGCGMTGNFAKLPKVLGRCYQQHIVNMTTDNVVNTVCGCGMTGNFAELPKDLDRCYQHHIMNMTTDNVVNIICGCAMTVATLHTWSWSDTVERLCRRLMKAAAHFVAARLMAIFRAVSTLPPEIPKPAVQALDECLNVAIDWAPPEEKCRAYAFLSHIVKEIRSQQNPKPDLLTNGDLLVKGTPLWIHANKWRRNCERSIVSIAPHAIETQAFRDLPLDLRKRLRDLGCLKYSPRPLTSTSAVYSTSKPCLDMEHVRASFVPYMSKPKWGAADTKKLASTNPPKIRTTKAQQERTKFNLAQTSQSQDRTKNQTLRSQNRFENTKPRYLESRPKRVTPDKKSAVNKLTVKVVSSSESSRNSSPVLARNLRTSRVTARQPPEFGNHGMSRDSLATSSRPRTAEPSTDSLSESQTSNKYATYTKVKHTKGSVESVTSDNRPAAPVNLSRSNMRSKIPVHVNHLKRDSYPKQTTHDRTSGPSGPTRPLADRKVPGSLMMATKSSTAKIVPKINKEQPRKQSPKQQKRSKNKPQQESTTEHNPADIPVMDRSGTFLKDEPTFGDKTTNLDIEE